jgi:hypothetical protein
MEYRFRKILMAVHSVALAFPRCGFGPRTPREMIVCNQIATTELIVPGEVEPMGVACTECLLIVPHEDTSFYRTPLPYVPWLRTYRALLARYERHVSEARPEAETKEMEACVLRVGLSLMELIEHSSGSFAIDDIPRTFVDRLATLLVTDNLLSVFQDKPLGAGSPA